MSRAATCANRCMRKRADEASSEPFLVEGPLVSSSSGPRRPLAKGGKPRSFDTGPSNNIEAIEPALQAGQGASSRLGEDILLVVIRFTTATTIFIAFRSLREELCHKIQ